MLQHFHPGAVCKRCGRPHGSWPALARCVLSGQIWTAGDGAHASVSECRGKRRKTVQLHPSHDQAEASLELLGRIRCGRKCKGLHRLANLAAEGFDIEEQPSAGCAAWCLAQVEQAPRVVVWNHWRGRVPVGFGLPNGQELTREQVQAIGLIDARAGNCVGSEIRPGWGQLRTYPELASRAAEEVAAIIGAEIVSSTASASR